MTYDEAMEKYGTDKPDVRFEMTLTELNSVTQGKGFEIFDKSDLVVGIVVLVLQLFLGKILMSINWLSGRRLVQKV